MSGVCRWCPHGLDWHRRPYATVHLHGRCRFPGCGCERGHVLPDSALRPEQLRIVELLREHGPLTTAQVGRRLGLGRAATTGPSPALRALERLYVVGRASPAPGRGKWEVVEVGEPEKMDQPKEATTP